ncbi:hypothetical protein JTE90_019554 [Oedothorax gibbosus]|uniref:Uncharacterized protein n=1 Tax=Oedothorax gibbosus TaxID=931172 RepID=A0AAV6TNJ8_9ARAC|nr:hypothetical protein JTE90_019554 [Oedothorax gibbosus]
MFFNKTGKYLLRESACPLYTQTAILSGQFTLRIEKLDDKGLKYYTGYSRAQLNTIATIIELHLRKNPVICESLDLENQVFMTLYMYRQAPEFTRLAIEMKINLSRCKLIISQWTQILYDILRNLDFWKEGQGNPNEGQYTAILDCTGVETQKPACKPAKLSQVMWSDCKERYTLKC